MSDDRVVRLAIRGRVQGVGYRAWARREAERRGLSGSVRNRPDGSVEAVLCGPPDVVDEMIAACRRGPDGAAVAGMDVVELFDTPVLTDFRQCPTV